MKLVIKKSRSSPGVSDAPKTLPPALCTTPHTTHVDAAGRPIHIEAHGYFRVRCFRKGRVVEDRVMTGESGIRPAIDLFKKTHPVSYIQVDRIDERIVAIIRPEGETWLTSSKTSFKK